MLFKWPVKTKFQLHPALDNCSTGELLLNKYKYNMSFKTILKRSGKNEWQFFTFQKILYFPEHIIPVSFKECNSYFVDQINYQMRGLVVGRRTSISSKKNHVKYRQKQRHWIPIEQLLIASWSARSGWDWQECLGSEWKPAGLDWTQLKHADSGLGLYVQIFVLPEEFLLILYFWPKY